MTRAQQSSPVRTAGILAGVVAVLYFAREILIPFALAVILALVLSPAVRWLQKLKFRRFPASVLVLGVSLAASGAIGYVIFNQLIQVINDLPAYRENIDHKIAALRTPNKGTLGRAAQSVRELGRELATPEAPVASPAPGRTARAPKPGNPLPVQIVEAPATDLAYLRAVTQPFLAPLAKLGIVLVFTVFLLVEESDLRSRIFRLGGRSRLNVMTKAVEDGARRVSRYLFLQFLVNAIFGLICGTGLYLIGVPYAALWGAVAALLRIVPYVGSAVAGLLPLLLSLAVFDGWRQPLLVFALFATIELVTGNLVEPLLYGAHTGISSLALLLTTVFWSALWGPAGLILATPLTVCVVVLGRHVPQLSFLHILLGDEPVLEPDAHLYQRLLAMDDHEARALAEQYRRENSLPQLYDRVILPALTMAEQDRHKGALDAEREEFLFLTVREMLAEFADETKITGSDQPASEQPLEPVRPALPGRILCLPSHDEADEIAAAMLAQLLERSGCATIAFPLAASVVSTLGLIEPTPKDIFCVSAVPPFAFSHARALSRELRANFPRTRIVVGIWGYGGERDRALQRLQPSAPDKFVTSLAEALEHFGVVPVEANAPPDSVTATVRV